MPEPTLLTDKAIVIVETTAELWRTRTFALDPGQQHPSALILALLTDRRMRVAEHARLVADRADLLAACEETFAHLTGWAARFEADGHLAVADILQRDINRLGVAIGKVKDREG